MTLFRSIGRRRPIWPGLAQTREDHPDLPPVFRRLPDPEMTWAVQHGIHAPESDPCGAPPAKARKAVARRRRRWR